MLTLAPKSWTRKKISSYFEVSEYLVRTARKVKNENGILSLPGKKTGNPLSPETVNLVINFYQSDEFSRMMPGKKDYVSIKKNQHVQKRLLLLNLNELHVAFKKDYPNVKVSLSKFCTLKPKWCITTNASGTHNVCVCIHHQNTKFLIDAIRWNKSYKDFMALIVYSLENAECMLHRCNQCPGIEVLKSFLVQEFMDHEHEEDVVFKQWQSTDRTTLLSQSLPLDEFNDLLCDSIDNLTTHSYIAKTQSRYLKNCKENLNQNECLILGDFAENYQYVVQDEVQSYHWSKSQCSLYTIVLYFIENKLLKHKSFCYLSEDVDHDTGFIYKTQEDITRYIKENLPDVSSVKYFSDGCAAQFKNFKILKIFINLCHHSKDFDLNAEWVFFATSHGKSPCDGIGGTVKRVVCQESLKQITTGQILDVNLMYSFCKAKINGIYFKLFSKEEIDQTQAQLEKRYLGGRTVPGTRMYHHFIPIAPNTISYKKISTDACTEIFEIIPKSKHYVEISLNIKKMDYIACFYDGFWWVGIAEDVSELHIKFRFMHPHGPGKNFFWPMRTDECWVLNSEVICLISTPRTISGRTYNISDLDLKNINCWLQKKINYV